MNKLFAAAILSGTVASPAVFAAPVDSYSYLSGGVQYSHLNEKGTDQYFGDAYSHDDQDMYGAYYNGSWNVAGNWFVQTKGDYGTHAKDDIFQSYTGVGYFQPINPALSVYGSVGVATYNVEHKLDGAPNDLSYRLQRDDSGASAEVGLQYRVNNIWRVQPAYRYSDFGKPEQEYSVDNIFNVSDHWAVEGNLRYRKWGGLDEPGVQLGVRYSY
ncbi:outer membrane beta-barrel protein [Gallaecimonas mangrovi]|uniref:outer membrane beta-barrel protein n=1 Tax=Gallaecimonas mangrovi TaxID=2291597 RepID=UPI000E203F0A|nr:outer membrane beta-barrel protein [Gallaecimonas mangrovi]